MAKKKQESKAESMGPKPGAGLTDQSARKAIALVKHMFGAFFDPVRILEIARAKAEARIIRAETRAEIKRIGKETGRQSRSERQASNLESIAAEAFLALPGAPSRETADEDWFYRFVDSCEDIGDEDMQRIWGKLLAGEIASPGTFSYLTLEIVRRMRRLEAEMFTTMGCEIWQTGHGYILNPEDESGSMEKKMLSPLAKSYISRKSDCFPQVILHTKKFSIHIITL